MLYHVDISKEWGVERMKKAVRKLTVFVLVTSLFLVIAAGAFAAEITVSNQLDHKLSITFTYYDSNTGGLVTKGWWHVEPRGETVVTLDADTARDIFYAAYNKDQFVDAATRGNAQIWRWAGPRNFEYTSEDEPADPGVWKGRFYKVGGTSLNIDARPR